MSLNVPRRHLAITLAFLLALLTWDASGLDLMIAGWSGDANGFPLRDHWLLAGVLHEGGRRLSWVAAVALCLMVWWPVGVFRRISGERRLRLVAMMFAGFLVVAGLKAFSRTSCPWDLAAFGRSAPYVPHWFWNASDGGGGRCFPAGHASAGFAFIGGYFAFVEASPRLARAWLGAALLAGATFGLAQQLRGAHFMSHTLWTAWLCWCAALLVDGLKFDAQTAAIGWNET